MVAEKTLGEAVASSNEPKFGDLRVHRFDERNWTIEKWVKGEINTRTGKPGSDHWKVIGYYPKLTDLAVYLLDKTIILPDDSATSGQQILQAILSAEKRIQAIVARLETKA